MRDERLEAALVANPSDPAPCLVYADWLSERGEDVRATAWRMLGGGEDAPTSAAKEAAVMAVASAAWLCEVRVGPYDSDTNEPDLLNRVHEAVATCALRLFVDESTKAPIRPRGIEPPPRLWLAVGALIDATFKKEPTSFGRAAQLARASAPASGFHRLFEYCLSTRLALQHGNFVHDQSMATALNVPATDDDLEPIDGAISRFEIDAAPDFVELIEGRVLGRAGRSISPWRAFAAMAWAIQNAVDDFSDMEPQFRRDFIDVDVFKEHSPTWFGDSFFTSLDTLFSLQASSESLACVDDEPLGIVGALERFGHFEGGASTEHGGSQFTLLQFERAFVLLHVVS